MSVETHDGGCRCGALRYRVSGPPIDAGLCHCRVCQQISGAPAVAWASVPVEAFTLTKGQPRTYASSSWGERWFCGECGAQILYRDREGGERVDINVATLDKPETMPPDYHIHRASRIAWFETADTLPRHDDEGPDV